jgi:predicted transposase/invertase (TIGR01784 family)
MENFDEAEKGYKERSEWDGDEKEVGLDDGTAAEMDFRRLYRLCLEMFEKRELLHAVDEREKDLTAQRFARQEYLDLTSDWAFKYLFRKHKDLLLMLLRDILNEDITGLEYWDSEMLKLFANDKTVIFDLLCTSSDGSEFIVEMQKTWRKDQRERLLYYVAALIRDQVKAGTREYNLKPVKIICIMDYEDAHDSVPENKIVFQYRLMEFETREVYSHQMSIYLVELPRVMRLTNNFDNPVAGWCQIFRNIATFAKTREGKEGRFREVVKRMKVRGLTDKEIEEYFSDMYTLEDYKPYIDGAAELGYRKGLEEGREEGREEGEKYGLEKGRAEERDSMVLKMRELNVPLEQIMSITGLSAEEITNLHSC